VLDFKQAFLHPMVYIGAGFDMETVKEDFKRG
jgi:hypothetical protein